MVKVAATRGFSKIFASLLAAACLWLAAHEAEAKENRYGAIVIDSDTGKTLFSVNPDRLSYPASLTKVMTLYLLFDALDSGKLTVRSPLPVSSHAASQAPSKLALRPGDSISVEDAVLALVTKSANDVAVVVAEALGGSEAAFARMMTRKAKDLGMASTVYRNASGLPNPEQVSTPRDQAALGRALIRDHGRYYHYFSTRQFKWRGAQISTHNRLMLRYKGADGIKTGYINASGFNLLSSAKRDGRRVVGVVFGGNTASWRDRNMAQILDKGFARLNSGAPDIRTAQADSKEADDLDRLIAATNSEPASREELGAGDAESDAWGVQVGAFRAKNSAHKAATAAAKKLGGLVSRASIDIDAAKQGKGSIYRARLVGFTEDQARAACKRLSRAKKACQVVQPSS